MNKTETILYFGSFNPIHNGHTGIARYVMEKGLCDELWFVVSPKNPLKSSEMLAGDLDRLRMTEIAVSEQLAKLPVNVCDIEFALPKPSYTIDTLNYLKANYPHNSFSILTGTDIMEQIDQWKNYETLLSEYRFHVYPREGYDLGDNIYNIDFLDDAPVFEYSSTQIRNNMKTGKDISEMLSAGVLKYILENGLYGFERV